jgi:hypothetical protein
MGVFAIAARTRGPPLVWSREFFLCLAGQTRLAATQAKNVTILVLPWLPSGLHIVCPKDSQRYYLLFTTIHNLFAPLFTSIRTLLKTQPLLYRHDSTKTRNSACVT